MPYLASVTSNHGIFRGHQITDTHLFMYMFFQICISLDSGQQLHPSTTKEDFRKLSIVRSRLFLSILQCDRKAWRYTGTLEKLGREFLLGIFCYNIHSHACICMSIAGVFHLKGNQTVGVVIEPVVFSWKLFSTRVETHHRMPERTCSCDEQAANVR